MSTMVLQERITELCWLVDDLGQELDALATTPYPGVHRFLMRTLTTRIARVVVQVQSHQAEPSPDQPFPSTVAPLVEQSA